jgi:hypothetical protein
MTSSEEIKKGIRDNFGAYKMENFGIKWTDIKKEKPKIHEYMQKWDSYSVYVMFDTGSIAKVQWDIDGFWSISPVDGVSMIYHDNIIAWTYFDGNMLNCRFGYAEIARFASEALEYYKKAKGEE